MAIYKKGYFKVSPKHQLYWELFGNPKGIPVVYFHGGPGAGFSESSKRFFDSKVFNVLFFDQRGSGRSKPFASTEENTTDALAEDTAKLMKHLGFGKSLLFGGSWGSTLALVFAIRHSELTKGLILRGIFLAHKKDINHYVSGGVQKHFPEKWERFVSLVPKNKRGEIATYYLSQMKSKNPEVAEKYAFEWAYYEMSMIKMKVTEKKILKDLAEYSYKSLALLEAHYMANMCFLPENYILKNAAKLSHLPVSIIHGRYDFVCPPINAYDLHKKIKGSKLHVVIAGHSASEKAIEKTLIRELSRLTNTLSRI